MERPSRGHLDPQLLVSPVVLTALAVTTPVVVFALIILFPPITPIVVLGYVVGMPFLFAFLMVGYCYELSERFDGRRPPLAAGIGVAASRLRLVAIAALAFGPGGFLVYYASALVRFVPGLERVVSVGIEVVSTFASPPVALSDADDSLAETFESLRDALEQEFGSVARGWKSAVAGSVGVWLVPFALAGNPLGTTSVDRETIREAALAPPWDGLPTVVTRLNLYNVIADGMHMVTISSVLEPVPRISRVALGSVVTGDAPPQAAAADLPLPLHQFAGSPIVALWIVVLPLAAIAWFDPRLN